MQTCWFNIIYLQGAARKWLVDFVYVNLVSLVIFLNIYIIMVSENMENEINL